MLLPLTSSLYVNGTLDNADTVLVELGTGYYAEVDGDPTHAVIIISIKVCVPQ